MFDTLESKTYALFCAFVHQSESQVIGKSVSSALLVQNTGGMGHLKIALKQCSLTLLKSALTQKSISAANKRLTEMLSLLESALTKIRGWGHSLFEAGETVGAAFLSPLRRVENLLRI